VGMRSASAYNPSYIVHAFFGYSGREIRVRIVATAPAALVTAVIKALAPR
jgi:hypothetical protein